MILALIIFAITYVLVVTELVDRTVAAVFGAAVVIILGIVPYEYALERVDLNVIFLLVGMMIVVNILSETGLFEWIAVFIAQKARGNGMVILGGLLIATALLSAFLDNVTTVVLIAPITILITQILEVRTIPFLLLEAIFSNIGGTATLIGDPPNILIGSKNNLTFNEFLINLSPPVIGMSVVMVVLVAWWFRKDIMPSEVARERIMRAKPDRAITDPMRLKRGLFVFALIILGFCLGHWLHIEPGIVALAGGLFMVVFCKTEVHKAMEKVEWNTIFFLIGLFMLVGALEYTGLFKLLGEGIFALTRGNYILTMMAILWMGGILAAALGNIPVAIAMIPLVQSLIPPFAINLGMEVGDEVFRLHVAEPLWWALALGTCLGGNGTLFGSAANVVVAQIARRNQYEVSYAIFAKYGFPVMIFTLFMSSVYLIVRYWIFTPVSF